MKIIVCGDIHGEFSLLNMFLNKENPDIILQCGDFGYWPKFFDTSYINAYGKTCKWQSTIKNQKTKIYWCDGNHEDHDSLLKRNTDELWKNVFYMRRGSILPLPDGRNVLFIGGALSIDKKDRIAGYDWFPQETISQKDIYNVNLEDVKIDIVISHTAPNEFNLSKDYRKSLRVDRDPSRDALSFILDKYNPNRWIFGHFHLHTNGKYKDTYWTALSHIASEERWWLKI